MKAILGKIFSSSLMKNTKAEIFQDAERSLNVFVFVHVPLSSIKQTKDMWAAILRSDSIYSKLYIQKGLQPYEGSTSGFI